MATYLVDIDGTVANTQHRQWVLEQKGQKNWELFFNMAVDDEPFPHMQQLLQDLAGIKGNMIIYCSGRPERFRTLTEDWLVKHGYPFPRRMYMRSNGDHRSDDIVKLELLAHMRGHGHYPTMAFDDRNSVVAMWRMAGVPCAQVAPGDF